MRCCAASRPRCGPAPRRRASARVKPVDLDQQLAPANLGLQQQAGYPGVEVARELRIDRDCVVRMTQVDLEQAVAAETLRQARGLAAGACQQRIEVAER